MLQESISYLKKLAPPVFARTEQERSRTQLAEARKITQLDIAIAFVIMADYIFTHLPGGRVDYLDITTVHASFLVSYPNLSGIY